MNLADRLLWFDLETSGLDPGGDVILEVGCIATDLELNELWRYSKVIPIHPAHEGLLNDFVREMHTKSGLLDECRDVFNAGFAPIQVLNIAEDWIFNHIWALAGSGIANFDRLFIREHMPSVDSVLVYYPIDTGVLRRCLRIFGGETYDVSLPESFDTDVKAHRALADADAHLREARLYQKRLRDIRPV